MRSSQTKLDLATESGCGDPSFVTSAIRRRPSGGMPHRNGPPEQERTRRHDGSQWLRSQPALIGLEDWRRSDARQVCFGLIASILACRRHVRSAVNLGSAGCPGLPVEGIGLDVIQAPKPEPRIVRYELTDFEWAAIVPHGRMPMLRFRELDRHFR